MIIEEEDSNFYEAGDSPPPLSKKVMEQGFIGEEYGSNLD